MNEAEILVKFFSFYGFTFNEDHLAIDIRSGETPYPLRFDALKGIKESFKDHARSCEILGQPIFVNNHKLLYMVVDPFKMDYSPAKVKVESQEAQLYQKEFQKSFEMLEKGELPL